MNELPRDEASFLVEAVRHFPHHYKLALILASNEKKSVGSPIWEPVFHYTSIDTLQKIITNRSLRFTQVDYLNDTSEYDYSKEKIITILSSFIDSAGADVMFQNSVNNIITTLGRKSSFYVSCFSKQHDLLSQWSMYTPKGEGVCVAFSPLEVSSDLNIYSPQTTIIYNPVSQTERIIAIFEAYFGYYSALSIYKKVMHLDECESVILRFFEAIIPSMKHPTFY